MVWKVKFTSIILLLLLLVATTCGRAEAATYNVYDGNPSSTYIQYFKDSIANIPLGDHYVAFRSGQYTYSLVFGDITLNGSIFSSEDSCTVFSYETNSSYNSYYSYSQDTIDSFYLNAEDKILYSDLGYYPQLEERGSKYEILTTVLVIAILAGYVVRSIFCYRPR